MLLQEDSTPRLDSRLPPPGRPGRVSGKLRPENKNRLSADELEEYCRRMTTERDYRNQMTYAVRVASEEGYEEGVEKL